MKNAVPASGLIFGLAAHIAVETFRAGVEGSNLVPHAHPMEFLQPRAVGQLAFVPNSSSSLGR